MKRIYSTVTALAALLLTNAAQAHTIGAHGAGLTAGLAHPFLGLDHLLAMTAVGMWASLIGGRAVWAVPAAFAGTMIIGAMLAVAGISIPLVEAGIAASVLVFGLLIFFAARFPLAVSMMLVGVFALFHGHSHGTELLQATSAWLYGFGFVVSTALLHLVGVGIGSFILSHNNRGHVWQRLGGLSLAIAGAAMLAGI